MDMLDQRSSVFDPERAIPMPFGGNLRAWLSGFPGFALPDPKIEIETTEDEVILKMPSPGCDRDEFEIGLTGDVATVRVRRRETEKRSGRRFVYRERNLREFEETVRLPVPVVPSEARANYANGVLTVVAAREKNAPETRRSIKIATE